MFKFLSILSVILFFTGIVFFIIKFPVGLILLFLCFGINFYIQKKYPDEFKQIIENSKNQKTNKTYKLKHIEGLNFIDTNSGINISMPDKKLILSDENSTTEIKINDIKHAAILEEIINDLKDKSVVVRTLVGGLLLGNVGAVVGGLTGIAPSYKKNKRYYLQIETVSGDDIILTGKINDLKTIKETIIKNV